MNDFYRKEGLIPDIIWYSPSLRTKQTAESIAQAFSILPQEEEALSFSFNPPKLIERILEAKDQTVFFVSHGPLLLQFAELLSKNNIPIGYFNNSAALVLKFDDLIDTEQATFIGYFDPEALFEPATGK